MAIAVQQIHPMAHLPLVLGVLRRLEVAAAVVLALFAQVALVKLIIDEQEVKQVYSIQSHHLLLCAALGLDPSWYGTSSVHKNGRGIQTPGTWEYSRKYLVFIN